MTVAADTAAVKAMIEAAGTGNPLQGHVFVTMTSPVGIVQARPYVVVHPHAGNDQQTRFTGPRLSEHPEFTFHIVGDLASSVQTVYDIIKAKFMVNGFIDKPVVSGRRNSNPYWRSPLPIQTDKSVTPWLLYAVVEYGWTSEPA